METEKLVCVPVKKSKNQSCEPFAARHLLPALVAGLVQLWLYGHGYLVGFAAWKIIFFSQGYNMHLGYNGNAPENRKRNPERGEKSKQQQERAQKKSADASTKKKSSKEIWQGGNIGICCALGCDSALAGRRLQSLSIRPRAGHSTGSCVARSLRKPPVDPRTLRMRIGAHVRASGCVNDRLLPANPDTKPTAHCAAGNRTFGCRSGLVIGIRVRGAASSTTYGGSDPEAEPSTGRVASGYRLGIHARGVDISSGRMLGAQMPDWQVNARMILGLGANSRWRKGELGAKAR